VDVTVAAPAASQLSQPDPIIRAKYPSIGASIHSSHNNRPSHLLHKCSAVGLVLYLVAQNASAPSRISAQALNSRISWSIPDRK
jgi:hypothetical protein